MNKRESIQSTLTQAVSCECSSLSLRRPTFANPTGQPNTGLPKSTVTLGFTSGGSLAKCETSIFSHSRDCCDFEFSFLLTFHSSHWVSNVPLDKIKFGSHLTPLTHLTISNFNTRNDSISPALRVKQWTRTILLFLFCNCLRLSQKVKPHQELNFR